MAIILLPIDGSIRSLISCDFILEHFNSKDHEVHIIHIMPSGGSTTEAQNFIENAKAALSNGKMKAIHTKIIETLETPAEEILKEAKRIKADIIVISAHGINKPENACGIGKVAECIVNGSECPVILVKSTSQERC
ncbi:MAG: universal stress protein [Candidatus Odinarchaeia archaeon]